MSLPLREWSLARFKSVDKCRIHLAPLTLVVGENSSGKSTLLQSILLASQAAQHDRGEETFSLNGPLVSLGAYEDVRSQWTRRGDFGFGGVFQRGVGGSHDTVVKWDLLLGGRPEKRPGATYLKSSKVKVTSEGDSLEVSVSRRRDEPPETDRDALDLGARFGGVRGPFTLRYTGKSITKSGRGDEPERTPVLGAAMNAGFPTSVLVAGSSVDMFVAGVLRRQGFLRRTQRGTGRTARQLRSEALAETETDPRELAKELVPLFREQYLRELAESSEKVDVRRRSPPGWQAVLRMGMSPVAASLVAEQLLSEGLDRRVILPGRGAGAFLLEDASNMVRRFLADHVHYLGPLRQDPNLVQRITPTGREADLGTRGEFTPWTLHAQRRRPVTCPRPPTGDVVEELPLEDAVGLWSRALGIADRVDALDLARAGVEIRVRQKGLKRDVDLANVGVGVSQLLPVIVLCLLADPGSLILLEQPELHLHPAVQQKLGDFLLACARADRQLIVETHSEYLISRLRFRAAEDTNDSMKDLFTVIFATRGDDGKTSFRSAAVNRYGAIDWPPGFFDQSVDESRRIVATALDKRRRE
jgi:predicted ATPase